MVKSREPARILIAIGNKKENRGHLQSAPRCVVRGGVCGRCLSRDCQGTRKRQARNTDGTEVRARINRYSVLRALGATASALGIGR